MIAMTLGVFFFGWVSDLSLTCANESANEIQICRPGVLSNGDLSVMRSCRITLRNKRREFSSFSKKVLLFTPGSMCVLMIRDDF